MLILYILSVLSFLALLWAAIAMTRHVRRNASQASRTSAAETFTQPPVASSSSQRIPPKSVPSSGVQPSIHSRHIA